MIRFRDARRSGEQTRPHFHFPYRTAVIGRRGFGRLPQGETQHPAISAWDVRRRSPKDPRNDEDFGDGPRLARSVSALADWLAGRAVQREPASPPQFPDLRENTGNSSESGFPRLAIGPDSLACTRTCAPRSLGPGTGNFVPRSRDSYPRQGESVERRTGPIRGLVAGWGCAGRPGARGAVAARCSELPGCFKRSPARAGGAWGGRSSPCGERTRPATRPSRSSPPAR